MLEISTTAVYLIFGYILKIKEQNQTNQLMTVVTLDQILRSDLSALFHHP